MLTARLLAAVLAAGGPAQLTRSEQPESTLRKRNEAKTLHVQLESATGATVALEAKQSDGQPETGAKAEGDAVAQHMMEFEVIDSRKQQVEEHHAAKQSPSADERLSPAFEQGKAANPDSISEFLTLAHGGPSDVAAAIKMVRTGQVQANVTIEATDPYGFRERIPCVYPIVAQYCRNPRAFRDLLIAMLERGADPNAMTSRSNPNPGEPGLMCAIKVTDTAVVRALVMHGASVAPRRLRPRTFYEASAMHLLFNAAETSVQDASRMALQVAARLHKGASPQSLMDIVDREDHRAFYSAAVAPTRHEVIFRILSKHFAACEHSTWCRRLVDSLDGTVDVMGFNSVSFDAKVQEIFAETLFDVFTAIRSASDFELKHACLLLPASYNWAVPGVSVVSAMATAGPMFLLILRELSNIAVSAGPDQARALLEALDKSDAAGRTAYHKAVARYGVQHSFFMALLNITEQLLEAAGRPHRTGDAHIETLRPDIFGSTFNDYATSTERTITSSESEPSSAMGIPELGGWAGQGWGTVRYSATPSNRCDIVQLPRSVTQAPDFDIGRYLVMQKPVMLRGAGLNLKCRRSCQRKQLLRVFGDEQLHIGKIPYASDYEGVAASDTPTIAEYAETVLRISAEEPVDHRAQPYAFESNLFMRPELEAKASVHFDATLPLLNRAQHRMAQRFYSDGAYDGEPEWIEPEYVTQFYLGPAGSGGECPTESDRS
jgi:hypothetical protein